jgi:hypothetical protein
MVSRSQEKIMFEFRFIIVVFRLISFIRESVFIHFRLSNFIVLIKFFFKTLCLVIFDAK